MTRRVGEAVLEESGRWEDQRYHDDRDHVLVGAWQRAESLRVQRMTHGDVTVASDQRRQPGLGQAQEVHGRVDADEHRRIMHVYVWAENVRARQKVYVGDAAQKQDTQQNECVAHGQRLQQHRCRHPVLLST